MTTKCEQAIPSRLPVPEQDRFVYMSGPVSDGYTNFVLVFGGRLDETRLRRALRLAMDSEPVFGCRYVPGRKPYWERRHDLDTLPLCDVAGSQEVQEELTQFVAAPCDATKDPLIQARIVRAATDTLFLKTNHLAVDGAASKQLLALIATLYRGLKSGDQPAVVPNVVPNLGSRGCWPLVRQLGWRECLRIVRKTYPMAPENQWGFPMAKGEEAGPARFVMRQLEPPAFEALRALGKRFGATLNDVLLTAYFRALWRFLNLPVGIPQTIVVPMDARRYLNSKNTEAMCNFVAVLNATLERIHDEPFEGTLQRVSESKMAPEARRDRALQFMLMMWLVRHFCMTRVEKALHATHRKAVSSGRTQAFFTNNGILDPAQFDFEIPLNDAYKVLQAAAPPGLILGVSSFRKRLTLTITYRSRAVSSQDVERFMDTFLEELHQHTEIPAQAETLAAAKRSAIELSNRDLL